MPENDQLAPDELRLQLLIELQKNEPDPRVLSNLADKLSERVADAVRFNVDAHHINSLGLELVAKQETALSELIKNAYDADATQVTVSFENYERPGGTITITDDGSGMTSDVVKRTWMRIATGAKADHPFSPLYGRRRAGRKGIGRFAVQRLGRRLVLETEVAGEETGVRVTFNWDEDYSPGTDLKDVWNKIERFAKPSEHKGTRLKILDLRDAWSGATFERVWKSVFFLQPPFKVARTEASTDARDPGFQVAITGLSKENQPRDDLSMETLFLRHAAATIRGQIGKDGKARVTVESRFLADAETLEVPGDFTAVGPTTFDAYYFVYQADALPGQLVKRATEMGHRYGGVRIYRNGFRVLPYGETNDDWLRLAYDSARRSILVPANNFNFFGEVNISSESNPNLEETSSREGLIENSAYDALRQFVRQSIIQAATRIGSARNRKVTATQRDFVPERKPSDFIERSIKTLSSWESRIAPHTPEKTEALQASVRVLREAEVLARQYERNVERIHIQHVEYENMLRIVSSLGLSIAMFGHEIKGAVNGVTGRITLLKRTVSKLAEDKSAPIKQNIEQLEKSISRIFDVGGYIESITSSAESRELKSVALDGKVEAFIDQFTSYLLSRSITYDLIIPPDTYRTVPMHASEIDAILFNLMTNSVKALRAAKPSNQKIKIELSNEDRFLVLGFEDNGIGIPTDIASRIFDAFFTTSHPGDDDTTGMGTGLGLKILSDIAESYGGSIILAAPSDGYSTRFEFRIPKAA